MPATGVKGEPEMTHVTVTRTLSTQMLDTQYSMLNTLKHSTLAIDS
jgi:hypothetical protein